MGSKNQNAAIEPDCSRGVQPGGICVCVVQRGPTLGGLGSGLRPGRKRLLCQLPLCFPVFATPLEVDSRRDEPHVDCIMYGWSVLRTSALVDVVGKYSRGRRGFVVFSHF
jgi:hypothetical protein